MQRAYETVNQTDEYNTPEHKLWAAVLLQGIHDVHIKETEDYPRHWRADARAWFRSKLIHIGGFIWICELFDLPVDETRGLILNETNN